MPYVFAPKATSPGNNMNYYSCPSFVHRTVHILQVPLCVKPWVGHVFGNMATAAYTSLAVDQRLVIIK